MKKIPSDIAIGSDIEAFLFDTELKRVVPSVDIVPGTKDNPHQVDSMPKGYMIQEDNVMVEFNIPPASTYQMFGKNIRSAKLMVLEYLNKNYGSKYNLYTRSHAHKFMLKDLTSPQAKTIGCEPDYLAYEGGTIRTDSPALTSWRSCGGHIHLGGEFKCPDFVSALFAELFIGVRNFLVIDSKDPRAKWYGAAGVYRPKPYGIEYRTPHNGWAFKNRQTDSIARSAMACARYLTVTDALTIQAAFRKINWTQVRDYMYTDNETEESSQLWSEIMTQAKNAGVQV